MRTLHCIIIAIFLLASPAVAYSPCFSAAGTDEHGNVFVVGDDGVKTFVTREGRYTEPLLSDDYCTVAWRRIKQITYHQQEMDVTSQLFWIRNGIIHEYSTEYFIRGEIWFVEKGKKIGVNIGALHYAGTNVLLDANSGEVLETFEDRYKLEGQVPSWVQE